MPRRYRFPVNCSVYDSLPAANRRHHHHLIVSHLISFFGAMDNTRVKDSRFPRCRGCLNARAIDKLGGRNIAPRMTEEASVEDPRGTRDKLRK